MMAGSPGPGAGARRSSSSPAVFPEEPARGRRLIALVGGLGVALCVVYPLFPSGRRAACPGPTEPKLAPQLGPPVPAAAISVAPPPPKRMHVVLTGGAGYIGSHTAMRLLEQGHRVTVLDNLSRGNAGAVDALRAVAQSSGADLRFVRGDVGDRGALREALHGGSGVPDLVIHFAAIAYVGESVSFPLHYWHNITVNTVILTEELVAARVPRLVFSSTCAVYGNPAHLPVTENTPARPMSPYGAAKLVAERIIVDTAHSNPALHVGVLRYFNVYGCDPTGRLGEWPRPALQQQFGRITNACLDAAQGTVPSMRVFGTMHPTRDGTCVRDFIHVMDLVDAHLALVPHVSRPPRLYNVGTGRGVSVRELLSACREVTGVKFKVIESKEPRAGDMAAVWADPQLIKQELGWRPRYTDVHDGLRHCWRWRQAHPQGYPSRMSHGTAGAAAGPPPQPVPPAPLLAPPPT
eukprot:TRINITY_DN23653_c0_g1_i1.p1 TRINITY_DN23653_c0_g1~~TRINITY_DN23653_c0_g1_i1.p1  ORF type:complete len:492 (+),score=91.75 TRINITY_DN23653_c0_g1_i1:85-1476(+)